MSSKSESSTETTGQHRPRVTRIDAIRSCACPTCHSAQGERCTRRNTAERVSVHRARLELAAALNA